MQAVWLICCAAVLFAPPAVAQDDSPAEQTGQLDPQTRQRLLEQKERLWGQVVRLRGAGRTDAAIDAARKALRIELALFGPAHGEVADSLGVLADLYESSDEFPAAIKAREAQLAVHVKSRGSDDWRTGYVRAALEHVTQVSKLSAPERELLDQADRLARGVETLSSAGKHALALQAAQRAAEIRKDLLGEQNPRYAVSLESLATLNQSSGYSAEAESLYWRSLEVYGKTLGKRHPDYARCLNNLASLYKSEGDLAPAESLYRQSLEIRGQTEGRRDPEYATTLNNLAGIYFARSDFARAEASLKESLEIVQQVHGTEHPLYAAALHNLASVHESKGDIARAEVLLRQALEVCEGCRGKQHPQYAKFLESLALLYESKADYTQAEQLLEQVVEIREQILGSQHPDYAESLNNLAAVCDTLGDFARAERLYRQSLEIREKVLGKQHPQYANSLNNLAVLYYSTGDYAHAEELLQEALEIHEQARGLSPSKYADSLNNLALLYLAMENHTRAEPLLRRSLEIREQTLGKQHPDYALSLYSLAGLYETQGDYARAEPLFRQSLETYEKSVGRQHPSYAANLDRLAALQSKMGDTVQAEALYRQSLEIREQILGKQHPDYADSLNNLAVLYRSMGDLARSEPLFQEALEIREQVLGKQHPAYAGSLVHLTNLYRLQGDYAQAEPLLRESLEIYEATFGKQHPTYAHNLDFLALLHASMGDLTEAELLCRQSLEIHKAALGERHPDYADGLMSLAGLYQLLGDYEQAWPLVQQSLEIHDELLDASASVQSERGQLAMAAKFRLTLDVYMSVMLAVDPLPPEVYDSVMSWKGRVHQRQQLIRLVRSDPELEPLFQQYDQTSRRLATLALQPPKPGREGATRREQLRELTQRKEQLEAELSDQSQAFREGYRKLTPTDLQQALPADAVLIDLLEYEHFDPRDNKPGAFVRERRLAAFVVRPDQDVLRVELGPAQPLASAIDTWREGYGESRQAAAAGKSIRTRFWDPLEEFIGDARVVFISPDGAIARFPIAALPGKQPDTYLLQEHAIVIVPVPAELARKSTSPPAAGDSLLLVGDVDFGASPGESARPTHELLASHSRSAATRGKLRFKPLPGTKQELSAVGQLFEQQHPGGEQHILRGPAATEASFRQQARSHHFVHVATHGFFADSSVPSPLDPGRIQHDMGLSLFEAQKSIAGFHPGLLSGLALAGANRGAEDGSDDGILTALEVAALDLTGVDLVVLSACQTGLGRVAAGEGILGLQRAFQIAGAGNCISSLWQVDDQATAALMKLFYYKLWVEQKSPLESLREAQLAIYHSPDMIETWAQSELRSPNFKAVIEVERSKTTKPAETAPPRLWAAFQLSGLGR